MKKEDILFHLIMIFFGLVTLFGIIGLMDFLRHPECYCLNPKCGEWKRNTRIACDWAEKEKRFICCGALTCFNACEMYKEAHNLTEFECFCPPSWC